MVKLIGRDWSMDLILDNHARFPQRIAYDSRLRTVAYWRSGDPLPDFEFPLADVRWWLDRNVVTVGNYLGTPLEISCNDPATVERVVAWLQSMGTVYAGPTIAQDVVVAGRCEHCGAPKPDVTAVCRYCGVKA